jgi:hypothetical protein
VVKVFIGPLQFSFEPTDVGFNPLLHPSRCPAQPVFFGGQHFDDLASASDQRTQFQGQRIGQRTQCRTHRFGKARQDLSVERIGFRQLPGGLGKIVD